MGSSHWYRLWQSVELEVLACKLHHFIHLTHINTIGPFSKLNNELTMSSRAFFERQFLMQYLSALLPERLASKLRT